MPNKKIEILGYASGLAGAAGSGSGDGPFVLRRSSYLKVLSDVHWHEPFLTANQKINSKWVVVKQLCRSLAESVAKLVQGKKFFIILGGDHTCAIGTWSGAYHALKSQGSIGLIWIDAHMDSHTPTTTHSGNLHGMPLACLLGFGKNSLINILDTQPKVKPENICLLGVRSYEPEEKKLLEELKVRVFYMDEIKTRGLANVMADAVKIATQKTVGFGLSIDIDSMDPNDAPGTGVAEPDGISANDLCTALQLAAKEKTLLGAEIVEFDPHRDKDHKTEKVILELIKSLQCNS